MLRKQSPQQGPFSSRSQKAKCLCKFLTKWVMAHLYLMKSNIGQSHALSNISRNSGRADGTARGRRMENVPYFQIPLLTGLLYTPM